MRTRLVLAVLCDPLPELGRALLTVLGWGALWLLWFLGLVVDILGSQPTRGYW